MNSRHTLISLLVLLVASGAVSAEQCTFLYNILFLFSLLFSSHKLLSFWNNNKKKFVPLLCDIFDIAWTRFNSTKQLRVKPKVVIEVVLFHSLWLKQRKMWRRSTLLQIRRAFPFDRWGFHCLFTAIMKMVFSTSAQINADVKDRTGAEREPKCTRIFLYWRIILNGSYSGWITKSFRTLYWLITLKPFSVAHCFYKW